MKLIQLLILLAFPCLLFSQTKTKKTHEKSIWINWGTWSLGGQIGTAHVQNLYSFSNSSNFANPVLTEAKYSAPIFNFKVQNITRIFYWNMDLGWPGLRKVTIETGSSTAFESFQGKARFGRLINIPVALGGFLTKRWGLWAGYNYSLFYLSSSEASGPYPYIDRFRAGDVGLLKAHGISFHTMFWIGKKSLLRFTLAASGAGNPKFNVEGSAVVTEFEYFIAFKANKLSQGIAFRYQSSNVKVTDHPFIGRYTGEPTHLKSPGLGIAFCFDLPEGATHRSSNINKK